MSDANVVKLLSTRIICAHTLDKAALKSSLTSYMRSLQQCPAKVRAFLFPSPFRPLCFVKLQCYIFAAWISNWAESNYSNRYLHLYSKSMGWSFGVCPGPFCTGSSADRGSGDLVGIFGGTALVVPGGYVSGSPLSDSSTWLNR